MYFIGFQCKIDRLQCTYSRGNSFYISENYMHTHNMIQLRFKVTILRFVFYSLELNPQIEKPVNACPFHTLVCYYMQPSTYPYIFLRNDEV